jgi:methylenetetrahydrofolate reductase (NADPH)
VTYGAGGTTQDRTIRVTERIADETTLTPLAHLTCVGVRRGRNCVRSSARMPRPGSATSSPCAVTRPATCGGQWTPHPEGGLDHADQLVALIRGLGDFTVGVAAFPDIHPTVLTSGTTSRCSCARPMPGRVSR